MASEAKKNASSIISQEWKSTVKASAEWKQTVDKLSQNGKMYTILAAFDKIVARLNATNIVVTSPQELWTRMVYSLHQQLFDEVGTLLASPDTVLKQHDAQLYNFAEHPETSELAYTTIVFMNKENEQTAGQKSKLHKVKHPIDALRGLLNVTIPYYALVRCCATKPEWHFGTAKEVNDHARAVFTEVQLVLGYLKLDSIPLLEAPRQKTKPLSLASCLTTMGDSDMCYGTVCGACSYCEAHNKGNCDDCYANFIGVSGDNDEEDDEEKAPAASSSSSSSSSAATSAAAMPTPRPKPKKQATSRPATASAASDKKAEGH
jgi:hypothetical protein